MRFKLENLPDIRQSKDYANYLRSQGWIVERIGAINYFIKKLPILGSVLKIQRPKVIRYKDILDLSDKYKTFQIVVEPNSETEAKSILTNGYKQVSPYLPSKTIHLDLKQSKEDIFRKFTKSCRYSIKRGEGIEVKEYSTPTEIKIFHNAWKKSVNFNRYVPSLTNLLNLKKSFPQSHSTFLASHNNSGSIIGGAIFTTSSHGVSNYITYYWQGFTNKEGRTSLSQYSLLYHGILWAKKNGSEVFDFEGIYDERFPNNSWLGFTHFKKEFGGQEVPYPGCYVKFRFPFLNLHQSR